VSELKRGWRRVKFGEVVRLGKERCADPAGEGIERYIGLEHLEPGDLRVRSWGEVADGTTFTTRVRPGHVLFGKRRAYQRKVAVTDFDAVCSGDIYVFESVDPTKLLPELLPFLCQTDAFFDHAVGTSAGSLSPRTNWTSLAEYEFPLPPLEEQRRMSSILERVRSAIESSDAAARWADTLFRSLRNHRVLEFSSSSARRTLDELAAHSGIVDGPFGSNLKSEHWTEAGVPVVQSQHITSGKFRITQPYYVSESTCARLYRSEAKAGDIVMVKKGVNCGACALLPDGHPRSLLSSNCMRIRINASEASPAYVAQFLHWYREQGTFEGLIGSTQQRATTLRDVRRIAVPVPPRSMQDGLVDDLQSIEFTALSLRRRHLEAAEIQMLVSRTLSGDA